MQQNWTMVCAHAVAAAFAMSIVVSSAAVAQAISDPMQRDELPGAVNTTLTIAPLKIATTSTRTVPVLVASNGSLPAIDFPVVTSGGVAPITFTITGGAAATLYQVLPSQAATKLAQPTAAQTAAAAMEAQVNPQAAGTVTRTVRFKGAASAAGLPAVLPVQIRATDARRASVTLDVVAYLYAPSVAPLAFNRTALQSGLVTFTVQGLGNAAEMRVDHLSSAGQYTDNCRYTENPNVSYQPLSAVTNGSATVSRVASFRTSSPNCSGLYIKAAFRFPNSATFTPPVVLTVPTFNFVPPQVYRFENTWALRSLFGFALRGSHNGTCSGESLGTAGTHKVGVVESSDDIAMTIRSGPIGTHCEYVSQVVRLPDGFDLTGIDFTLTEGPNDSPTNTRMGEPPRYCSLETTFSTIVGTIRGQIYSLTRGTRPIHQSDIDDSYSWGPYDVEGWDRPLKTPDGVTLVERGDTGYAVVLMPIFVGLKCVNTPSNTEFVRVRLNSVQFVGPPGVAFP